MYLNTRNSKLYVSYVLYLIIENILFILGDSISTVEYYDPIVSRWQVDEPMRTLRSRVGIAVLQGNLLFNALISSYIIK